MGVLAFLFAYILGGLTALPLLLAVVFAIALWTSVPVGDVDPAKRQKQALVQEFEEKEREEEKRREKDSAKLPPTQQSKPRKGWLTVRRAFDDGETGLFDGSYMDIMRSILDSRSKDPKKSRPRDTYFAVLKGSVLFLYEDEAMSDCHTALEMSKHAVDIYPPGLLDGELFTKRNAIRLSPNDLTPSPGLPHVSKEMKLSDDKDVQEAVAMAKTPEAAQTAADKVKEANELAREEAFDFSTPWYLFVRSVVEMEDWYHALVHASKHPTTSVPLEPLEPVFSTEHMQYLVSHLDTQPDPIPMRWLNALVGRLFFSVYKTAAMEDYIIGRLMKKLAKVKKPSFLDDIVVKEVSVGSTAPTFYKPMLKELTKEGDASVEIGVHYKGEIRITVETTATINLGARFRSYEVKLVLAIVLRELEGNVIVKVKPPPSNRIWYAFTKMPKMELAVEPVVSDRQITWGMILKTIEGRLKEIILESVVLPNYDDIAFFETSAFGHRGGIYADAVRQSLRSTDSTVPATTISQTQSMGVVEALPRHDSMENLKMPGHYSTTALPLTTEPLEVMPAKGPDSSVVSLPIESQSEPKTEPITGTTTPMTANVLVEPPSPALETPSPRGRPISVIESDSSSLKQPREPSVPASNRDSMEGEADQGLNLPSRKGTPRSSPSPAPSRASHSASQSVDMSSTQQVKPVSTSSTFTSNTSTDTKPNGSFLDNLRSRAAAAASAAEASNPKAVAQARETFQKWGAQWAGLKKNLTENRESRSNSISSTPSTSTLGLNVASTSPPSSASISRGFDDMRRVVAERRQREDRERVISDVGRGTPLEVPADKSRRQSAGPVLASKFNAEVDPSGEQILPSTSPARTRTGRSDSVGNARGVDLDEYMGSRYNRPPTPKTAPIVVETRLDASPALRPLENTFASTSPSQKPQPIVSQPAYGAMSMTIPGIHAKHRNEVMSMGSAPFEPAAAQPKEEATATTSRLQGIGNIYRLLKKTSTEPLKAPPLQDAPSQAPTVEPTTTPPETVAIAPMTTTIESGESRRTSMEGVNSSSPASVALLSLVARDELARKKSLTRRRTGSMTDHQRQRSDSTSSSPLASSFAPPGTSVLSSEPEPLELTSR